MLEVICETPEKNREIICIWEESIICKKSKNPILFRNFPKKKLKKSVFDVDMKQIGTFFGNNYVTPKNLQIFNTFRNWF